jgi:hypothetical protein
VIKQGKKQGEGGSIRSVLEPGAGARHERKSQRKPGIAGLSGEIPVAAA